MGFLKRLFEKEVQELDEKYNNQMDKPTVVSGGSFWLVIEDVFTITGRGTVVTGRVEQGSIATGESVYLLDNETGTERIVTVTGINALKKSLDYASEGDVVGLLLKKISRNEVKRGDTLHK